ncbi:UDP-N-acetylmuramoyl-L-alanyl-D-glutamate--2,6-diaminopimelate ligase [Lachnotalea sp. AF33-28]|uniref:UDP-N-acetylmuramoyl-L-alanyl-D-glutamate--2, 6-diaminopimelate ligase n=1 Tax=Lachnotalea sp. AF33-28 TaxID=2292046 RepID=UPI000E4FFD7C|nr:UDP-N-acetylmuramoyl-L-alanyl-D-glutamate--2,6-diaminopimelate ligase [Lachnotalea sp. AF33-28]RHP29933.1 UDP-N-acetylmuramoyl-L-alanyl-D-glutamate--2,6-diaminopimelate ligase [Lachnotalea sp. AF33-28]
MTLSTLLENMDYKCLQGTTDTNIHDIVYDSRKAGPGDLFVCISGTRTDAHSFLPEVIQKGVKAVAVERDVEVPKDVTVIRVARAREALSLLSAAFFGHPAARMTTIGVTGTKGKTTTSFMIKAILEACGKKVGLIGTIGALIGGEYYETNNTTPESYELQKYFRMMADGGCEYLVMEVSSQGIMMDRVAGMQFDYGIFTNITPDHIGENEHKDFADYLSWKRKLLQICRHGYVNRDDSHYEEIIEGHSCDLHTFGVERAAQLKAERIHYLAEGSFMGIEFETAGSADMDVKVNIPGLFNVYNALAAISVCLNFSLPPETICHALEHLSINGRMELVYASDEFSVIVDYAHNAVSMESLLTTLKEYHPKRLVCLFGCGGNRSRLRRYDMGEIGGRMADLSIITADNSRYERVEDILNDIKTGLAKTDGSYLEIPDRREAIRYAISHAQKGDMIVIIGKGHEDYQEIQGVRHHFSDQEEVRKALEECADDKDN